RTCELTSINVLCGRTRNLEKPFRPMILPQISAGRNIQMDVAGTKGAAGPSSSELEAIDRYWRAANYISVGQIYLMDNPLLREPLQPGHVKPRLLGHWGTTPGLNFVYAHLNRVIRARDLNVIYICGPGHGGPAMVANT